jgi:hypothetical protein
VPYDSNYYHSGDYAEILYPGDLEKKNLFFSGWSFENKIYQPGEKILIQNSDIELTAIWTAQIQIGTYAFGGIVFYIFQTDDAGYVDGEVHGLVAAEMDQNQAEDVAWAIEITEVYAFDTLIGTGHINTLKIVEDQGEGLYAAKVCDDLNLNGYDDWFLPSICELKEMYNQKDIINKISEFNNGSGFDSIIYWSSTASGCEYGAEYYPFDCSTDYMTSNKLAKYRIRAARAF